MFSAIWYFSLAVYFTEMPQLNDKKRMLTIEEVFSVLFVAFANKHTEREKERERENARIGNWRGDPDGNGWLHNQGCEQLMGQQLTFKLEGAKHCFLGENHGLKLDGADSHPSWFKFSYKPLQCIYLLTTCKANRATSSAKKERCGSQVQKPDIVLIPALSQYMHIICSAAHIFII